MNVNVWFVNERIIIFVVPLLIVPTESTDYTEAYGLKLFESTEWPTLREARIHRNDCLRSVAAFGDANRYRKQGVLGLQPNQTHVLIYINEPSPCLMFLCSLVLKYIPCLMFLCSLVLKSSPCLLFFCSPVFKISPVSHVPLFSCLSQPPR